MICSGWAPPCGSEACIFNILGISVKYSNMEMLERGYGISLRHLTNFAQKTYADGGCFAPKVISAMDREISGTDSIARLYKAVLMIQFKLEGQAIMRNPSFCMEDRLLLDKIDYQNRSITIGGVTYALEVATSPLWIRTIPTASPMRNRRLSVSCELPLPIRPASRNTWSFSTGWDRCTCASMKTCSTTAVSP